jgi:N-methylhydantoinase A
VAKAERGRLRVSMDIGGTFTDIVVYDQHEGTYQSGKVPTTPEDLTEGVLHGLESVIDPLSDIAFTVHGTTVGLNAFLQRRGEHVLLLATSGAADVYQIARGVRTRLYDLHFRKPEPLVARGDTIGIGGRLDYRGQELVPLDEAALILAAERARDTGIRAIAVAFLFSYVNPTHELRAEEVIKQTYPGASVSLSHRVAREWREYERTSSTVLDAYIAPVVARYLERLESAMQDRGLGVPLHVLQSSGGVLTAKSARDRPIQTLLSGPAGGTIGGAALAETLGRPNLLCIDMGGTSFDMSLVVGGKPDVEQEAALDGLPLLVPLIKIHTIGAGGGSIAYLEAGGLRVGPVSAGADPGPACYARGGDKPTVTDANLVLGRIDPGYFLGGRMQLDPRVAEAAIADLGASLDLDTRTLAEGILDVVNAKMAQAIRTITVEKGIEPRDFAIVAFGGAGPMHAAFLAEELEIREIIVPPWPGAFSAWGMLQAKLRHDLSVAFYERASEVDLTELAAALDRLGRQGRAALLHEGVAGDQIGTEWTADMRYVGQEYTVSVSIDQQEVSNNGFLDSIDERFNEAHSRRYGHANPGAPIEFVVLRASVLGDLGRTPSDERSLTNGTSRAAYSRREVVFKREVEDAVVAMRDQLRPGSAIAGPSIIEDETATTVVPPGWSAALDPFGSITLTRA